LSLFIIISVLPDGALRTLFHQALVPRLNPFFFAVFSLELALRLALFVRSWLRREARSSETLLLMLDFLAVASFLPLATAIGSPSLRLVRLFRLLLLVGYWGRQARQLLGIVTGPERRYQVVAVIFLALMVSFVGALLVDQLVPVYDFNGDGQVDGRDRGFFRTLWWSFRQVQDTGNLVPEIDRPSIVALSLLLTLFGVFLFSVIVGIGTGAIEELLERVREQPVGMSDHTVILGLTPYSSFLLDELAKIYRKNLGSFRGAVLGTATKAPAFFHRPMLRGVQYRRGNSVDVDDLDRVNVRHAKRVLVLGTEPEDPDGGVIAAILAVREHNSEVDIYPDVEHERNFSAMRSAGGSRTHLVGSGSFLGYYIAQNVIYPGIYRIHRHLLTSSGCEVYTHVFSAAERRRLVGHQGDGAGFDPQSMQRLAFREYGVNLIGLFVARDPEAELQDEDLEVILNPLAASRDPRWQWVYEEDRVSWQAVRGLIGVTLRWKDLHRLAEDLSAGECPSPSGDGEETPPPASALVLRPARTPLERVLICGDSDRVPRVIVELFRCFPRLDVTVATTDAGRCRRLARQIGDGLTEVWGAPPEIDTEGDKIELRAADTPGRVLLLLTDRADDRRLRHEKAVDVETADAVLLLPGPSGAGAKKDLDGRVALDCLHMANLVRGSEITPRPGLHILGFVSDPVKGDLLERRFSRITDRGDEPRFTIISSERARHHFIMQNVFVRGLNSIYLDLMGIAGQHLARLKPFDPDGRPPAGTFDPGRLAAELLCERQLILLGYETVTADGDRHVELDPRQMQGNSGMPWTSVRALYVLGSRVALAGNSDRSMPGMIRSAFS
ncbi:MAG: hypothetical protein V3T72_21035, partial [Thermoanaerobaculia bacterium]